MKHRLAILTEIIAPYRIPVFNALAEHPEIEPHVIFFAETDSSLRQWPIYKDEIRFSYEVLSHWRRRLGKYNLLLNLGLKASLQRVKPDAVLCGGYSYLSCWSAVRWAKRERTPLLLWSESTASDARGKHQLVEFLKARFLEQCEAFVAAGKSSASYLSSLGVPERTIFTAPNAVDIHYFSFAARRQRREGASVGDRNLPERFFLYVGRLVTEKGIFELLEAYAKLDSKIRSQIGLVYVGDGAARRELEVRIYERNLRSVHCVGFAQRDELAGYYARAEALVLPTHSDTWGLVVNEAMACGLPVITTHVAGCAPDLVEDGWNGFVVAVNDVPALSYRMRWLGQQPGLRHEMGERSLQRIQSYSPAVWADGLAQAVNFVCARSLQARLA